jgi:hypothetical protein
MPVPEKSLLKRIEQLEQICQRQQELIDSFGGRDARGLDRRWVYLAKTIKVGATYPTSGNTFGLQFIDREFSPLEGNQTATDRTRSATSQQVGRTLDGSYIEEGTVIACVPAPLPPGTSGKGRWHILTSGTVIHRGITLEPMTKGSLIGSAVTRYLPGTRTLSTITDQVFDEYVDVATGKKVAYMAEGSSLWLLAVECPPT